MADPELAAIRAARMSQLQQNAGAGGEGGEDEGKRAAEEQMRRDLLATVLDHAARERRKLCGVFSMPRSPDDRSGRPSSHGSGTHRTCQPATVTTD